jgi:myo-inositol-1(or 4)-monophosphatase
MIEEIKKIVKEAGQIILNARNIQNDVESKQGRANFVTKYDVEVQKFLYRELAQVLPEAAFLGEEDDKRENITAEYCFIIDPIDGTTNFIFDYRHSAISVGLMHQGHMLLGVVYNPYLDEMFCAEQGKGSFLNGRQLTIKDLGIGEGIVGFGTCPYYRDKSDQTFELIRKLYDKAMDIRRSGSAALDICYKAAGRFVLFFEMLLSPWDYAAASLILTEAGGRISSLEQKELPYMLPTSVIAAAPKAYEEYFEL